MNKRAPSGDSLEAPQVAPPEVSERPSGLRDGRGMAARLARSSVWPSGGVGSGKSPGRLEGI